MIEGTMQRNPRSEAGTCHRMDTCLRIATPWIHAALAVGMGTSCMKAPREGTPEASQAIRTEDLRSVRTSRARCDGVPCSVTVELTGNRQVPSGDLFAVMRVVEDDAFGLD